MAKSSPAERFVLIGLDGLSMEQMLHMVREGRCPNVKGLLERGVHREMWGVYPTLTPPGWTSIATGTWPATHQVMDFKIRKPGAPLDVTEWGINTRLCKAEYLWNTIERAGRTPLLVKFEMSWPPTLSGKTGGVQVEGTGPGTANHAQIAGYHHFVAGPKAQERASGDTAGVDPSAIRERLRYDPITLEGTNGSTGWRNLPASSREPLGAELPIQFQKRSDPLMRRKGEGKAMSYYAIAYASGDGGYDRVRLTRSRDGEDRLFPEDLKVGQWSDFRRDDFVIGGTPVAGHVHCKLITLSPDGARLELFFPQIWPVSGYTFPDEVGEEIAREVGPFRQNPGRDALGVIDDDTYFESLEQHLTNLSAVAGHLAKTRPAWTALFTQTHAPDYASHFFIAASDPVSGAPAEMVERSYSGMVRTYEACDRWIGRLLEAAVDEKTVVCLVSDHGGTPTSYPCPVSDESGTPASMPLIDVADVLEQAGLLVYMRDAGGAGRTIDWAKTKAAPVGVINIFVNLKGREPTGIVEQGEEYEQVCRQIIHALTAYRDPNAGYCPFNLALRRVDAEILNVGTGELVGDVVYAMLPEFDGAHGHQLPSARLGWGGQHALFVLAGAGVKRGVHIERQVRQVDVAPTLAYLTGLPMPADCEGRVVMEALEEPSWHLQGQADDAR